MYIYDWRVISYSPPTIWLQTNSLQSGTGCFWGLWSISSVSFREKWISSHPVTCTCTLQETSYLLEYNKSNILTKRARFHWQESYLMLLVYALLEWNSFSLETLVFWSIFDFTFFDYSYKNIRIECCCHSRSVPMKIRGALGFEKRIVWSCLKAWKPVLLWVCARRHVSPFFFIIVWAGILSSLLEGGRATGILSRIQEGSQCLSTNI